MAKISLRKLTYEPKEIIPITITGAPITICMGAVHPGQPDPDWVSHGVFYPDGEYSLKAPDDYGFYVIGAQTDNQNITTFATIMVQAGPADIFRKNVVYLAAALGIIGTTADQGINFLIKKRRK